MCRSSWRRVEWVRIEARGAFIAFDIQANAFLHHMVRNMVGCLLAIGKGERDIEWLAEVLRGRDRTQAAATAAASGLYLATVSYPRVFGLPRPHDALVLWPFF